MFRKGIIINPLGFLVVFFLYVEKPRVVSTIFHLFKSSIAVTD